MKKGYDANFGKKCWERQSHYSFFLTEVAGVLPNPSPSLPSPQEEAQPISVLQEENQQLRQQLQVDTDRGLQGMGMACPHVAVSC